MRVIVFGTSGWIGSELAQAFRTPMLTRDDCDISNYDHVLDSLASDGHEPICVINATGKSINGLASRVSTEDLAVMMADNLCGSLNIVRAFSSLNPAEGSSIILLGSVVPRIGVRGASLYAAAKAGIQGAVRSLARDLAPRHRINAIELGYFDGGMISSVPENNRQALLDVIPLGRLGEIESVIQTCRYLMHCSYATGGVIPLTGGL